MPKPVINMTQGARIYDLMVSLPLFEGLDDALLDQFVRQAQVSHYRKGQVLHLQEDPAEWFYIVVQGWVKLFRETLDGDEAVIDVLTKGHLFGENSVFEHDCYSCAVEVVEDAELIVLPTSQLKQAIVDHNQLALNMLSSMSRFRLQQHREIEHLNAQSAPQRIGCFLLRLSRPDTKGAVTLHLPYDKTLVAARLGMKPETFSRALGKLKDATNLRVSGPTVYLDDIQRLIDYSCTQCSSAFPCSDLK